MLSIQSNRIRRCIGSLFLILSGVLSGCAKLTHFDQTLNWSVSPRSCVEAPYCITNLTVKPANRYYQLPDGHLCRGER